MTPTEIRAAYDSGDTALIDRWACEVMGESVADSHEFRRNGRDLRCNNCGIRVRDKQNLDVPRACTRYTTDLTSAAELEAKIVPKDGYWLDIRSQTGHDTVMLNYRVDDAHPAYDATALGHKVDIAQHGEAWHTELFERGNEALNRTTAALYAMAWENENSQG